MLYMSSRQQIITPGNKSCKYCRPKCLDIAGGIIPIGGKCTCVVVGRGRG